MLTQYEQQEMVDCLPVAALIKGASPLSRPSKQWIQGVIEQHQQGKDGEGDIHNKLLKELSPQKVPEKGTLETYAHQVMRKDPSYVQAESKAKL